MEIAPITGVRLSSPRRIPGDSGLEPADGRTQAVYRLGADRYIPSVAGPDSGASDQEDPEEESSFEDFDQSAQPVRRPLRVNYFV